mgnify:CR=1 FL=1
MDNARSGGSDRPLVAYFGNDWGATNRTSSHHIAERLSRWADVLYIDSPGMRPMRLQRSDLGRALRKFRESLARPVKLKDGLWRCTVPQLPFRRLPGMGAINRVFVRWAVRRCLRGFGERRTISWFVVPHPGFLARRLGEALCVYYCTDQYAAHPGVDSAYITACDERLTRDADIVFVVPPALLEAKRAVARRVEFAPHGVDFDLFARAADPAGPTPALLRGVRHPVVGYFGSIHEWTDVGLIAWLARQRPTYTFLLVGHVACDPGELPQLSNVLLPGAQPYAELADWARTFDVAILPYRLNQQVLNANPLKLREYLATGKPVVSVTNPEIEKFAGLVRIAHGREEFLAQLDAALREGDAAGSAARQAAVRPHTWDARAADVYAIVRDALDART